MTIQQLGPAHFRLVGNKRKVLSIVSPNTILILFKTQNCQGCARFEPEFVKLSQIVKNIGYGIVDLTNNRDIIDRSRQTETPIQLVPTLILYSGGIPYAKYNGRKNINEVMDFLNSTIAKIAQKSNNSQFVKSQPHMQQYNQHPQSQQQYQPQPQPQPQHQPQPQPQYQQPSYQEQNHSPYRQMGSMGNNQQNTWQPEIGREPAMGGIIKGYNPNDEPDFEDNPKLQIPEQVTPHNTPWDSLYKEEEGGYMN
ncbi:protein disulfide isomerase family protein [bacterium]|nr:protein disulfide isomerase family protein [bacterium]